MASTSFPNWANNRLHASFIISPRVGVINAFVLILVLCLIFEVEGVNYIIPLFIIYSIFIFLIFISL